MSRTIIPVLIALITTLTAGPTNIALASDCSVTSVGLIPLNELGAGQYLNLFEGGLYPGGVNVAPTLHAASGRNRALAIGPLDTSGNPDSTNGKIVLLSIGMSNTTQEFCSQSSAEPCDPWTFTGQAMADSRVNNTTLEIINGARGGQASSTWEFPTLANYDIIRDTRLAPKGLTEAQVQVVWVKVANPGPAVSLPNVNADAFAMVAQMGNIARALKVRYPNLQLTFFSSRIYAGYATTMLNPEPFAYESGFAVKWLIEAQIEQMAGGGTNVDPLAGDLDFNTIAPWIGWGPYLWADGLNVRSDGLLWLCNDLEADGTHPAMPGETKVGTLLLDFMLTCQFATPWFRNCELGDVNGDGLFDGRDIAPFVEALLNPAGVPLTVRCASDANDDGVVNLDDVPALIDRIVILPSGTW